jgi:hypothetical protein
MLSPNYAKVLQVVPSFSENLVETDREVGLEVNTKKET